MPIYPMDAPKKDGLKKYRVAVSYTATDGSYKQVFRTTYGKEAAADLERRLIEEYKKSTPAARLTVAELAEKYLAAHAAKTRLNTRANVQSSFRNAILPYIGSYRLNALDEKKLLAWQERINSLDIITSTKNVHYGYLNAFLNWAVRMKYIPRNPLSAIGRFVDPVRFDIPSADMHYYTADQFLQYFSIVEADAQASGDWRYYVFFAIAFYTGMRKGEICALKWSDIDFRADLIHVCRSITQRPPCVIQETFTKTRSSYRILQMPRPLIDILRAELDRQAATPGFSDDWRVAGGAHVLAFSTISDRNKKYAAASGLPRLRIHDFRHTHTSILVNAGINIQEVSRRLGHSNVKITWDTYSHMYPIQEERAVAVLDAVTPSALQEKQEKNKKKTDGENQA